MDARIQKKAMPKVSPRLVSRQVSSAQPAAPVPSARPGRFSRYWLGVEDAAPVSDTNAFWRDIARFSVIGLFAIALLAVMHYARPVLLPVVLAVTLGIVLTPLSNWASKRGVPASISAVVIVAGFLSVFGAIVVLLSDAIRDWIDRAPELIEALKQRLQLFDRPLAALNALRESITGPGETGAPVRFDLNAAILQPVLGILTPAAGQIIIFIGTLIFFLADPNSLKEYVVLLSQSRDTRLRSLRIVKDIERNLVGHFGVVTAVNLCLGISLAVIAWAVGLPNPLVWGVMAAVLNYVPYIGAAIVIASLFAVSLVSFDTLGQALLAPALYLGLATIEGQFIVPSILGRRLTMNPLTIFVAIAFWGWVWGAFGALLAVPLLIVGMVLIKHIFPKTDVKLPG